MLFRGTYEHTVDDRGRIAVPARYRDAFAEGAVLVKSPDGCVELYTSADYEAKANLIQREPDSSERGRQLRRSFFADAFDADLDKQGRLLMPAALRSAAGLNGTVTIVGRGECLEIWEPSRFERQRTVADQSYAANLEAAGALGAQVG